MPQLVNMVLKDHAGADVTFSPKDNPGGVATLVSSTGVPVGDKTAVYSITRTQAGKRKVNLRIALPVVQDVVVAGISRPTIVRTAYFDGTFSFDGTSNTIERQDLRAAVTAMLANAALIIPAIDDLAGPF